MDKLLIGVLIVAYNHDTQALESILKQKTAFSFDVAIEEDCSTYSTRAIIERYAKRNSSQIKVVTGTMNVGALVLFHTKFRKFLKFYFSTTEHLLSINSKF